MADQLAEKERPGGVPVDKKKRLTFTFIDVVEFVTTAGGHKVRIEGVLYSQFFRNGEGAHLSGNSQ